MNNEFKFDTKINNKRFQTHIKFIDIEKNKTTSKNKIEKKKQRNNSTTNSKL